MSKPNNQDVKKQLERVLKSAEFQRSSRLSSFLKYIVEKTIAGEGEKITGYSIGIDVFGKRQDFDSDFDSSVRVEAVRLRKALALYFHEEGKSDPVIISVPRGGYQPVFLKNLDVEQQAHSNTMHIFLYPSLVTLTLISLALSIYFVSEFLQQPKYSLPQNPVVAIGSFNFVGGEFKKNEKKDIAYLLSQKFSRFGSLRNIVLDSDLDKQNKTHNYLLEGTIRQTSDQVIVDAWLMDAAQDTMVWRYSKKYNLSNAQDENWKGLSSSSIVSALASMHGIIDTLELKKYSNDSSQHDEGYKCLLDFMAYDNNKTEEKHLHALTCLEKLVKHFPDYSLAWAYLSWLYGDEVRNNLNPRDGDIPAQERALEAGLKAVESNQMNARAHMYLATAALLNDKIDLMKRHIKISVELNPYDSDVLASAAWKYGRIGEWELNREYGEAALEYNPSPPKWYHGAVFGYYFHMEQYDKALFHALSNFQKDDLFSRLCLIAAYVGAGQHDEAMALTNETKRSFSEVTNNMDHFMESWKLDAEWKINFMKKLSEVGL